jgi:ribonucleotide reductase beta subunit family protein with ferritin-like domain
LSERLDAAPHTELEEEPRPFRALYEHWERNQWSLFDLDFSADRASFEQLDDVSREGLMWIFAHRFDAEFEVAKLLPPFVVHAPDFDVQLVLATQLADEHRHLQAVLRVYDEVFGIRGIDNVRRIAEEHSDPVAARLYDEFERYLHPLQNGAGPDAFLGAVVAYHLLAEGVVARTAQNLAVGQYERFGEFPGLIDGQRHVARDEARHIGIGVSYVRRCAAADPEHTYAVVGEVFGYFSQVAAEMLETAQASMGDLVRAGYGTEPDEFYGEAMRLLQLRMRSIGFSA